VTARPLGLLHRPVLKACGANQAADLPRSGPEQQPLQAPVYAAGAAQPGGELGAFPHAGQAPRRDAPAGAPI